MESQNSEQTPRRRTDGEPYKGLLPPTLERNNNALTPNWTYLRLSLEEG